MVVLGDSDNIPFNKTDDVSDDVWKINGEDKTRFSINIFKIYRYYYILLQHIIGRRKL
jgi:hypothetical protein